MLYEGDFSPPAGRFAIVAARFNAFVVDQLLAGAVDALRRHGVSDDRIDTVRVPGSFEIPPVVQKLGKSGKYAAVICLGCVIRGETTHYEAVAGECASGIQQAQLETGVPIAFGALTVENLDQALARSEGPGGHNVGEDGAKVAVEMAQLVRRVRNP